MSETRPVGPLPDASALAAHFDALFQRDADPWRYRTSWYEARKRALMLASLPQQRYARAFEPACANGELSAELATRCDELLCVDGSVGAAAHARERLAGWAHVQVRQAVMPDDWPEGRFDLVVLSEFGYYLEDHALSAVIDAAAEALTPGGTLLACHWRHPEGDYFRSGDAVHRAMRGVLTVGHRLTRLAAHEEDDFLIDIWSNDARSVARREGLR